MHAEAAPGMYGYVAEYTTAEELVAAAKQVYAEGYTQMDAFTPFPVHGLPEAIGFEDLRIKWIIFAGGIAGAFTGFYFQYWVSASAYAHNVGGRPFFSWPAFIPVTFECTILFAALSAVFGMLALNKLPQPHHPVFDTPRFDRASQDSFFLAVEAKDPLFDAEQTRSLLEKSGAQNISLIGEHEVGDW
jgi:hypothetical protein